MSAPRYYRALALPALPSMFHPDYFRLVEETAAIIAAAEPWLLWPWPGEPRWVANWRCPMMRLETERLNVERRLRFDAFWLRREALAGTQQ